MKFSKEKRDVLINLRVTKSQRDLIKKMASNNGKTLTDFILDLIEKYFEDTNN